VEIIDEIRCLSPWPLGGVPNRKPTDYKRASRSILRLIMAKKAKRRGRPPGSKNKGTMAKAGNFAKMEVAQLRDHIGHLQGVLSKKVGEQRTALERQLAALGDWAAPKRRGRPPKADKAAKTGKRAKAQPKYQSKKDKSVKWSGRGMTPVWMREEMKGTKLKKDDFLIS
jgi:DNA-binding protein H-NS